MKHHKQTERIELGELHGVAEYYPTRARGDRLVFGWTLRMNVPGTDYRIEGFGTTQEEAHHMFLETAKQWLKDTNSKPVIT